MPGTASSVSRAQRQTGRPHSSIHSLSPNAIRRLWPAATSTAAIGPLISPLARLGEDHAAGDRLQHPGHRDPHFLLHEATSALDYDHRPVVQVADTLAGLLAFLDDLDLHLLARVQDRFDRVRQLADVKHPD